MTSTELQTISFHGDKIFTFSNEGVPHVAMRPIVENLGLSWSGQRTKIQAQKGKFNCADISTVGADGRTRQMLSMPTKKLTLWLASVNPNKIKDSEKRRKIELYQEECAEALYNYWHNGVALRDDLEGVVTELDPKVMQALGGMMKGIVGRALTELVPVMVQQQLASQEIGVVHGVTSYDAVKMAGVTDRKGLRGLGVFVSNRLTRYHNEHGVPVKMRDYGAMVSVRVFDKQTTKDWLRSGGKSDIDDYISEKRGQSHLKLVAIN